MAIRQYHFSASQNSRISEYTHTFNMTPHYLRAQLLALREVTGLKLQLQLPLAQPPLFFFSKVLQNCFQSLCYVFTNFTFLLPTARTQRAPQTH